MFLFLSTCCLISAAFDSSVSDLNDPSLPSFDTLWHCIARNSTSLPNSHCYKRYTWVRIRKDIYWSARLEYQSGHYFSWPCPLKLGTLPSAMRNRSSSLHAQHWPNSWKLDDLKKTEYQSWLRSCRLDQAWRDLFWDLLLTMVSCYRHQDGVTCLEVKVRQKYKTRRQINVVYLFLQILQIELSVVLSFQLPWSTCLHSFIQQLSWLLLVLL